MRLRILPLIAAVMVLASAPEARAANCASPTGVEATLLYNKDYHVLQYCDGTNWIGMAGAGLDSGLAGWWKFDDGSGTTAADSSGNGNTGTLTNGPTWTTGQVNGAVQFDGGDDYVDVADSASLRMSGSWTMSTWVKFSALPASGNHTGMVGKEAAVGTNYLLAVDNGDFSAGMGWIIVYNSTGCCDDRYAKYTASISTGVWYHVAGVYDSSAATLKLYVNGALVASFDATALPPQSGAGGDMSIGAQLGDNTYMAGVLDDVRVYNRALSAAEVYALYSCTQGTILYNADYRTPQYCNGSAWQGMAQVYTAWGVTFDGTNDYLTRGAGLTGSADSTKATSSFWFRRNGGNGTTQVIWCTLDTAGSCRFQIYLTSAGNQISFWGLGTSGAAKLIGTGSTSITDTSWHHVLFSVDLTDTAKRYIYLDGVAEASSWITYVNAVMDFTRNEHSVGAFTNGASKFNGDLADFYLDMGTWTDLSVAVKRELFRDANGKPVNLGSDGSTPTGTAPEVFLSDTTLSTWPVNKGSGGGFTVNGALTEATGTDGAGGLRRGLVGYWKLGDEGSSVGSLDIGQTGVLTSNDGNNCNLLLAQSATLPGTGTIQSMSFYVQAAFGQLRLGIYDATGPSGGPGAKKAETAEITPVTGWNTANVTTPVALAAGTYWLAYMPSDCSLSFWKDNLGGGAKYYSYTYGTMPATFSTTPSSTTSQWSFYASFASDPVLTAVDSSGNGNTGTLTNGPTWTNGQIGGAVSFDGVDDFVVAGNPAQLQITGSLTISQWIKASTTNVDSWIVSKSGTSGAYGYFTAYTNDNTAAQFAMVVSSNASTLAIRYGATTLSANTWYHVVGVYNAAAQTLRVYLNGVDDSGTLSGSVPSSSVNSSSDFSIGARDGGFSLFPGLIDDVRIYNRALSAADVAALYANSAVCSGPSTIAKQEGTILYNADYHVLQYCDGLNWRGIGK